ncbi:unnamed protein product [Medioppia subpectinata]|uniref:STAR protein homodimerisation region domain-containing protein n=1 Tax=Medioppia subpectinata TaxID=1979941 RepID=A0A7R9KHU2_9ACAR|nr:unnamed protein product [Medioppia subpectinata]CAG2102580.1 unnamed protein product [Medioppia subpectinata]
MGENSNSSTTNSSNNNVSMQSTADYLAQLLKDRKQLIAFPNVFIHIERLLDEVVLSRVNSNLLITRVFVVICEFCERITNPRTVPNKPLYYLSVSALRW